MKKRLVLLGIAALAVSVMLTGCGGKQQAKADKVIQIGTNAEFPPFEFQEGNGEISGFDAELIREIGKAVGMDVQITHMGFDAIFEGIDRGKVDAGVAAITITEDRKKTVDFTEPYFDAKQYILVPEQSNIKSLKELKGKKIGVQSATTGEAIVQEAFGKTYEGLKGYDETPSAINDLQIGRLDAVVVDSAVVVEFKKKLGDGKFKIVEDPALPVEQYGIAVKKGNGEMLKKLNEGLKKVKENGTYDKIHNKYFGNNK
ncbi:basic amino acid ABC transporter substrate-binding protein [Laceyella putida]|uniref:Basic amino acid ABC transporter substrate-binding protein n=1 Tax=Laceyella putida TaxID=110101 RepID=A0ABW2RGA3_9BACL